MKKRKRLRSWVKVVLVALVLVSCVSGLQLQNNAEQERAYAEGRTQKCYTSTGDVYYK